MDTTAFRDVAFARSHGAAPRFPAAAFDLVCTSLALGQMGLVRERAPAEMPRVTCDWTFDIGPCADANNDLRSRLHVVQRGFFRGRLADPRQVGLEPAWATMDYPQVLILKSSAVLARKRP